MEEMAKCFRFHKLQKKYGSKWLAPIRERAMLRKVGPAVAGLEADLTAQRQARQQEMKALSDEYQMSLEDARRNTEILKAKLSDAQTDAQQSEANLQIMLDVERDALASLQNEVATQKARASDLQNQLLAERTKVESLQHLVSSEQAANSDLSSQLSELENKAKDLQRQVSTKSMLEMSIAALERDKEMLEDRLKEVGLMLSI